MSEPTFIEQFMQGRLSADDFLEKTIECQCTRTGLAALGITAREFGETIVDGPSAVIRAAYRRLEPATVIKDPTWKEVNRWLKQRVIMTFRPRRPEVTHAR